MKKNIVLTMILVFICCVFLGASAHAASGDIVGNIYATDIKAYINGVQVPSYNIGGKTAVIAEEITECYYNDELRTLIIGDLSPTSLIEGENVQTKPNGSKIGNIYETDIKTYLYDKQLTSYSLNGRMAVAIEELGDDNAFSDIGGKYIWNEEERTLRLEFMYRRVSGIYGLMREKTVNLEISDDYELSFASDPIHNGYFSSYMLPQRMPQPLTLEGEIVGYLCQPTNTHFLIGEEVSLQQEKGISFFYFDEEKIAAHLAELEPVSPTVEDWLEYYEWQMFTIADSLETEDYVFLYMSQANTHGSSQFLHRIARDGTRICYEDEFESVSLYGNKFFDNVVIDKEGERVTFRYDADYEIDLKTSVLSKK